MRYALIDLDTNTVVNVVVIDEGDGSVAPENHLHVASEIADIGDGWDGTEFVKAVEP